MRFDPDCRRCVRLSGFLDLVKNEYPDYHARPVAPFGDNNPDLLIVGLAPGMHGANATGRPFTGDHAGIMLYDTLYKFGFSNKPESLSLKDGLKLKGCRITNAVKCLPPQNKPLTREIRQCNPFLAAELNSLKPGTVLLALGRIAHEAILRTLEQPLSAWPFAHGTEHELPNGLCLVDSYHCSRYNTQTRRLTEAMFHAVFEAIRSRIDAPAPA